MKIDPLLGLIALIAFITGYIQEYLFYFLCISLHECGHIAVARFFKARLFYIKILPVGLNAFVDEQVMSSFINAVFLISGPAVNFLLFCILYVIRQCSFTGEQYLDFFITANLSLSLFNLLPVVPLDGGNILKLLIKDRIGLFRTGRLMDVISTGLSILLILTGTILACFYPGNISLLAVGLYLLFNIKKCKMEAALMNVKNIIYRRSRLMKKGVYAARDIVALKGMYLSDILKFMDFDRFHIVYVLDNDLKISKVYTEQQIIEAILKYNSEITFEEFAREE